MFIPDSVITTGFVLLVVFVLLRYSARNFKAGGSFRLWWKTTAIGLFLGLVAVILVLTAFRVNIEGRDMPALRVPWETPSQTAPIP